MIAKEWRDARWKLLLGLLAFLLLVPTIRSYEAIQRDVEFQIDMMQRDLRSPEKMVGPTAGEREQERFVNSMRRDITNMQSPEYVRDMARWELRDTATWRNLLVIVPLAGLFGIGLVSGEVGRGSIFLLLARPVGRTRTLLTKYAVCAACLFVVAAVGGVSVVLVAYARGYPPESVSATRILVTTVLTYLGSLFVLGVSLMASVIFRDVLRTLLATVAALFVILAGPDLLRSLVQWIVWGDRFYMMEWNRLPGWYRAFDRFRLFDYWIGVEPFSGNVMVVRSVAVCTITSAAALLLALCIFRRKTF